MKLFNAVAAAGVAVLGGSFVIANPAESQDQLFKWQKAYEFTGYVRGVNRRGNFAIYTRMLFNRDTRETSTLSAQANCKDLTARYLSAGEWSDWFKALPGTETSAEVAYVCR